MPRRNPTDRSPFLQGAYTPVYHESFSADIPTTGSFPDSLDGIFTQIGPNPLRPPRRHPRRQYAWFSQEGFVSGVRIRDGKAAWSCSKWIRSRKAARALSVRAAPGPRHFPIDTVHTNIIAHNGLALALVETGCLPVRLDTSLDTVEYTDLSGRLPRGFAAHPKCDPTTGQLHLLAHSPMRTWADYLVLGADSTVVHSRKIMLRRRPMVHDVALTENFIVFFDTPVQFNIRSAATGRFPYEWHDHLDTAVWVVPRPGCSGSVRRFEIPPCFIFHTVNARESRPGVIELKAVRYRKLFDDPADPFTDVGHLWKWEIDTRSGRIKSSQLNDRANELPRIDSRRIGQENRYYYAVTTERESAVSARLPDAIMKHDLLTGNSVVRACPPGRAVAEPIFIPRPGSSLEDDGWIAYFEHDFGAGSTDLLWLDAQDLNGRPVAVAHLPFRVPAGFHCSWLPAEDIQKTDLPPFAWPPRVG